ncbi:hypothetical protein JW868_01235 [Candidatus Woesearchaeota archaeon]|nr:hypothetical protein [Candidatus Woesearchaeota archaeon]
MEPLLVLILSAFVIILFLAIGYKLGYVMGRRIEDQEWRLTKLESIVKDRVKQSRSVIGGQFSEQLAPYLPDFPYSPSEVRFLGKPIDFLVFKGLDDKEIEEVVFVEIKSGRTKQLSTVERRLRDVINAKKVKWEKYEVPDDLTK